MAVPVIRSTGVIQTSSVSPASLGPCIQLMSGGPVLEWLWRASQTPMSDQDMAGANADFYGGTATLAAPTINCFLPGRYKFSVNARNADGWCAPVVAELEALAGTIGQGVTPAQLAVAQATANAAQVTANGAAAASTAALNADLVSKLALLDPSVNPCTVAGGTITLGDGGGWTFGGIPSLGLVPDNINLFASSNAAYLWLRMYSGHIDMAWNEVRPDGGVADQHATTQALLDTFAARGAGHLYFPEGIYRFRQGLIVQPTGDGYHEEFSRIVLDAHPRARFIFDLTGDGDGITFGGNTSIWRDVALVMRNIRLVSASAHCKKAIKVYDTQFPYLENCSVDVDVDATQSHYWEYGLWMRLTICGYFDRLRILQAMTGVHLEYIASANQFLNLDISGLGSATSPVLPLPDPPWYLQRGIEIDYSSANRFVGGRIEGAHAASQILVKGASNGNVFNGVYLENYLTEVFPGHPGVPATDGADVVIEGAVSGTFLESLMAYGTSISVGADATACINTVISKVVAASQVTIGSGTYGCTVRDSRIQELIPGGHNNTYQGNSCTDGTQWPDHLPEDDPYDAGLVMGVSTKTINWKLGASQKVTMSADCAITFTNPSIIADKGRLRLQVIYVNDDYMLSWTSPVVWDLRGPPTRTMAGQIDELEFTWNDARACYLGHWVARYPQPGYSDLVHPYPNFPETTALLIKRFANPLTGWTTGNFKAAYAHTQITGNSVDALGLTAPLVPAGSPLVCVPMLGLTEPRNGVRLTGANQALALAAGQEAVADPNSSVVGVMLIYRMLGAPVANGRILSKRAGGGVTGWWDCYLYDDHTISLMVSRGAAISIVRNLGYHVSLFDNHFHALGVNLDDVGKVVGLVDEIGTAQSGTATYSGSIHSTDALFSVGSWGDAAVPCQPMDVIYTLLTDKPITTAMLQKFMVGVEGRY